MIPAVKSARNRGEDPGLSFYRDKTGLEIDLIREYQRYLYALEIKAGICNFSPMICNLAPVMTAEGEPGGLIQCGKATGLSVQEGGARRERKPLRLRGGGTAGGKRAAEAPQGRRES